MPRSRRATASRSWWIDLRKQVIPERCEASNPGSRETYSTYPLPLWERVARMSEAKFEPGEGLVAKDMHDRPIAKRLRNFAKKMRREATKSESGMWRLLRDRRLSQFKFRRQVPFQAFILDFVCFEQQLVIEIDGSQHFSSERDRWRDRLSATEGFRVLRYWNNDVLQRRSAVLEDILTKLSDPLTRPRYARAPSPTRGEGKSSDEKSPVSRPGSFHSIA